MSRPEIEAMTTHALFASLREVQITEDSREALSELERRWDRLLSEAMLVAREAVARGRVLDPHADEGQVERIRRFA